jgi:hypothetical protein
VDATTEKMDRSVLAYAEGRLRLEPDLSVDLA